MVTSGVPLAGRGIDKIEPRLLEQIDEMRRRSVATSSWAAADEESMEVTVSHQVDVRAQPARVQDRMEAMLALAAEIHGWQRPLI